jgi:hypothetical protein
MLHLLLQDFFLWLKVLPSFQISKKWIKQVVNIKYIYLIQLCTNFEKVETSLPSFKLNAPSTRVAPHVHKPLSCGITTVINVDLQKHFSEPYFTFLPFYHFYILFWTGDRAGTMGGQMCPSVILCHWMFAGLLNIENGLSPESQTTFSFLSSPRVPFLCLTQYQ